MENKKAQDDCDIYEKNRSSSSNMEQKVKSRAVVKYSAVQAPANFARLQCNTDLNLPPSNWLTSSAESYGLQHVLCKSTGFSSFRMAHMFPDCMGDVDVVSDAENIKKLLKIPYSRDAVSMMVHCIEKTLLIDEFDVHKHLLRTSETDWEWLRKFFFEQVLQTISEKDVGMSIKDKSRHALQQRALVSKFLHYSLAEPGDQDGQPSSADDSKEGGDQEELLANKWPPLPEPRPEEKLPDPATDHTFNRNVVWTFEDIQMLLGTDMPIFGGSTHPCMSLRLRDMTKPINVLTGIDYWLDNLMCNVPEVVMCYHLDGIVQRYELVKTEDLPQLPDSKFSPCLIREVAQHILSFLKSNATKAGHTYWLFKGKDDDVVKLYDLTSLCSDSLVEKGQNPFTVPVGMLLYRVARNMKNSADPSSMRPGTIRALLNNCLALLPKEKYPQIVTSAHYMLSDIYLPLGVDPQYLKDEAVSPEPPADDEEDTSPIKSLCISPDLQPPPLPPYVPPPPLVGSVGERCQQALEHVVAGLQCLPYFEIAPQPPSDHKEKKTEEQTLNNEPKMAQSHQPIPMPYSSLSTKKPKASEDEPEKHTLSKKKKKKKNGPKQPETGSKEKQLTPDIDEDQANDVKDQFPVYFWNSGGNALLKKPQAMALPTWQTPDTMDNISWKGHLKTLLYEKACLVYNTLAEAEYAEKRYGKSLLYVKMVLRCHTHMARGCGRCTSLVSGMLGRAGDNCFHITRDWGNADSHRRAYEQLSSTDSALAHEMAEDMADTEYPYECVIIPETFETIEQVLLSSCSCYQQALMLRPSDALRCRSGNVHNELSSIYMTKITAMEVKSDDDTTFRAQLDTLLTLAQHHLDLGQAEFARIGDNYNLALLLSNAGKLMRMQARYRCSPDKPGLQPTERAYYEKALSLYRKGLGVLGSRKSGPQVWDVIMWELSTTLYTMAILYQDNPPAITDKSQEDVERELIELLTKALQSCDLEATDFRQCMYQFRAAMIHYRLGSLYQHMYRTKQMEESKRKNVLHLVNLHYDKSAWLMGVLEHPSEYLRLQMERVALQEYIADKSNSPNTKLKALESALDFLISCRPVLESIVEKENSEGIQTARYSNQGDDESTKNADEDSSVNKEGKLLVLFESRIQFILKSLVKLCASSSNQRLTTQFPKYKEMYSLILKQKDRVSLASHLCTAVNAIERLR